MAKKIIDGLNSGIILKETPLYLSDVNLKNILSKTYERAQIDMSAARIQKIYSILLSIAGTLCLSLLTSSFHSVFFIKAEVVTGIAWVLCGGCALVGFILMFIHMSQKAKNNIDKRDLAVDEIFAQHFKQE